MDVLVTSKNKKVQVSKDQEKAQSEKSTSRQRSGKGAIRKRLPLKKDSHSKNQGGKKPNLQSGTYTMKTFRKPNEQLFSQ